MSQVSGEGWCHSVAVLRSNFITWVHVMNQLWLHTKKDDQTKAVQNYITSAGKLHSIFFQWRWFLPTYIMVLVWPGDSDRPPPKDASFWFWKSSCWLVKIGSNSSRDTCNLKDCCGRHETRQEPGVGLAQRLWDRRCKSLSNDNVAKNF